MLQNISLVMIHYRAQFEHPNFGFRNKKNPVGFWPKVIGMVEISWTWSKMTLNWPMTWQRSDRKSYKRSFIHGFSLFKGLIHNEWNSKSHFEKDFRFRNILFSVSWSLKDFCSRSVMVMFYEFQVFGISYGSGSQRTWTAWYRRFDTVGVISI